jgi:uncharacterized protein (DUF2147 family)
LTDAAFSTATGTGRVRREVVSMKRLALLVVFLLLASERGFAAEPIGDWQVEDGSAHIRIVICRGSLWGVIGWEKTPGKDTENPDPAKKSRPTLGIPILIDMKPGSGGKWEGQIYNAQNGKMYKSNVTLVSDNALKVQGCVLGGLFCGGETWTRVTGISGPTPNLCTRLNLAAGPSH